MSQHIKVVGVLYIVFGALFVLSAFILAVVFGILASAAGASAEPGANVGMAIFGLTGAALAGFLLVVSIPSIACGWGLLKHRRWARVLGIVLAALALLQFPYGTIFGVYALWVLFSKKSEPLFDGPIAPPRAS